MCPGVGGMKGSVRSRGGGQSGVIRALGVIGGGYNGTVMTC